MTNWPSIRHRQMTNYAKRRESSFRRLKLKSAKRQFPDWDEREAEIERPQTPPPLRATERRIQIRNNSEFRGMNVICSEGESSDQLIKQKMHMVATDTKILDLRTRSRTKFGWFFWFWQIQRYDTTMGKWQILYLQTRYRSKLGWFFWFGPIPVTIRRNLGHVQTSSSFAEWPHCVTRSVFHGDTFRNPQQ